jgi:hypothetical protein
MIKRDIEKLITMPKRIIEASSKEFKEEYKHFRRDFKLQSLEGEYYFRMFIRRHKEFQENFSIGLDLLPSTERGMPLIRCNGPHYVSKDIMRPDPHYAYHIHKPSCDDIEKGLQKLSLSEITQSFNSYNGALAYFIRITNIINAYDYFDPLENLFGEP